jgi:phospholipase/carboxylesterase
MSLVAQWREPLRTSGGKPPLVVLFHGRGSDERDLLACADALPPGLAFVAPRGPLALDFGGYTWFENRGLGRPLGESLRASVDLIQTWLDGLDPARFDPARIFLFGFSAGMLIASALLLDRPERFAGAVLLSGTLPWDNGAIEPAAGCFAGIPVFYARGDADEVIPLDLVARSVAFLENESGASLTAHRYPIGHQISSDELRDIGEWLGSATA